MALAEVLRGQGVRVDVVRSIAVLEATGLEASTTVFVGDPQYLGPGATDTDRYARYFRGMLERGFTLAPSQFEAAFVGLAHSDADVDAAVAAAGDVLAAL